MQRMLDQGFVKSVELPSGSRTVKILLERGWVESSGDGKDRVYRVTEKGLLAKRAPIPPRREGWGRPRLPATIGP